MYGRVPPVCSDLDEKTTKNSESKAEDSNDTIENSSNAATKPKNVRSDLWKVSQHAFNFCTCSLVCTLYSEGRAVVCMNLVSHILLIIFYDLEQLHELTNEIEMHSEKKCQERSLQEDIYISCVLQFM